MKGWGFYFPCIPRVTSQDIGILQRDGTLAKKENTYDYLDQFHSDP